MPFCDTCDGHYSYGKRHAHKCPPVWHAGPAPDEDETLCDIDECAAVRGHDAQDAAVDYITRDYGNRAPDVGDDVTVAVSPDHGRTWKLVRVTANVTLDTEVINADPHA